MITRTIYPTDFHLVLEIILRIKPDNSSFLIESCCIFLHDFIMEFSDYPKHTLVSRIGLESIYKWLACVPEQASKIVIYTNDDRIYDQHLILKDLEYINGIITFSHEISIVENLGQFMADEINYFFPGKLEGFIFAYLVNFYRRTLNTVSFR
ncbi:hypothetical protein RF11_10068 [Thelohanellus kitauei]|uniref:Uncharacterized protein n=1 Tax=Thelohanellus kitauei TaxID=669202 RepID=A0A0C2JWM8_THEKT|nr:hypothetical protein RF11_10068 [Thelohanellus kitauei]